MASRHRPCFHKPLPSCGSADGHVLPGETEALASFRLTRSANRRGPAVRLLAASGWPVRLRTPEMRTRRSALLWRRGYDRVFNTMATMEVCCHESQRARGNAGACASYIRLCANVSHKAHC